MMATTRPPAPIPTSISEAARHYLSLPAIDPPSYPALDDIAGWLRLVEQRDQSIAQRFTDDGLPVTGERREVAGVGTYVLRADGVPDADSTPIYVDMHGGALIFAGGDLSRVWGSMTASTNGMITWSIDYRMPPLHPYPAALDDCLAVYRAVLELRDPADIFVGGASAGGNLAAALMVRARDEGLPMPAGLVLPTPMVDLTESGDTFQTLDGVHGGLRSQMAVNLLYANGHDLTDPYLSPLFADLSGLPPTFLCSGTRDLFLSNTVRMHRKLLAAGVEAELHIFEAMPHGGFGGTTPEDIEVDAAILAFLDKHRRAS
jgi:epsilon-lactone hydrolase